LAGFLVASESTSKSSTESDTWQRSNHPRNKTLLAAGN
jgi:hypothetical protein